MQEDGRAQEEREHQEEEKAQNTNGECGCRRHHIACFTNLGSIDDLSQQEQTSICGTTMICGCGVVRLSSSSSPLLLVGTYRSYKHFVPVFSRFTTKLVMAAMSHTIL